jgi:serine/threonine protein kinase
MDECIALTQRSKTMGGGDAAKSPNVLAVSSVVQVGCTITLAQSGHSFIIAKELGAGNFGITFEARNQVTGKKVAIKVQSATRARQEASIHQRLEAVKKCDQIVHFYEYSEIARIIDATGRINPDPHLEYLTLDQREGAAFEQALASLQSGESDAWQKLAAAGALQISHEKLGCIVMELVDGESIAKLGPCEASKAARIAVEICKAVAHLHRWYFVHGDLKPENVLISRGGRVKVLDFSTAKQDGESDRPVATSFYAPIMQHQRGQVDRYSDLYSVMAIFYRLVTGHEPAEYYTYTLTEGIVTTREAFVRKHFDYVDKVPADFRDAFVRTVHREISGLPAPLTTSEALNTRLRGMNPGSQDILEYVPQNALSSRSAGSPPKSIQELAGWLQRPLRLRVISKAARAYSMVVGVIFIGVILVSAGGDFWRSKHPWQPPNAAQPSSDSSATSQPPVPTRLAAIVTPTPEGMRIASLVAEAEVHAKKGEQLHTNADQEEDATLQEQTSREALVEYQQALDLYRSILDSQSAFSAEFEAEICKNAYAIALNMSIVDKELQHVDEAWDLATQSLAFLDRGHRLNPDADDMYDFAVGNAWMGALAQTENRIDPALEAYEKSLSYLDQLSANQDQTTQLTSYLTERLQQLLDQSDLTNSQTQRTSALLLALQNMAQ